uniref:G-patch domain-containing protein n=1 Tax=Eutreptiella gymnastica TaxID=73025 RepID=A0A7S4LBN3_9EUGL
MDEDDVSHELSRSLGTHGQFGREAARSDPNAVVVPSDEYIGHRLLRKLGWRYGEGIGPKVKRSQATAKQEADPKPTKERVVGCALPAELQKQREQPGSAEGGPNEDSSGSDNDADLPQAPVDVRCVDVLQLQDSTCGLGFDPLNAEADVALAKDAKARMSAARLAKNKSNRLGFGDFDQDDGSGLYGDGLEYDVGLLVRGSTDVQHHRRRKLKEPSQEQTDGSLLGYHSANQLRQYVKPWFPPPVVPPDFILFHNHDTDPLPAVLPSLIGFLTPKLRALLLGGILPHPEAPATASSCAAPATESATAPAPAPVPEPQEFQLFGPLHGALKKRFVTGTVQELVHGHAFTHFKGGLYVPKADGEFAGATPLTSLYTGEPDTEAEKAAAENQFGALTRQLRFFFPEPLLCKRFGVPDPHPYEPTKGEAPDVEFNASQPPPPAAERPKPGGIGLTLDDSGSDSEKKGDDDAADQDLPGLMEDRPPMDLFDAIFGEEDEAAAPEENTQSAAQPISALHQMEAEQSAALQDTEVGATTAHASPAADTAPPQAEGLSSRPVTLEEKIDRLKRLLAESSTSSEGEGGAVVVSSGSEGAPRHHKGKRQGDKKASKKAKKKAKKKEKKERRKRKKRRKSRGDAEGAPLVISDSESGSSDSSD